MRLKTYDFRFAIVLICILCAICGSVQAALNANTVWEVRTTGAQTNGGGFRWLSLVSATYKWTASGSGTNEYYCQAAAGGNPSLTEAKCGTTDGTFKLDTNGTLGSLNAGEWDWGDNDALGYSTIYVRLDAGADPDTKNSGFVQIGNGGGYDYTQQNGNQLSLTDGYFTSGTTLKSDTGGFTALMVGNIIRITSGTHFIFTANTALGWYEIATYVSSNEVTLDRASATEDTSAHKDAVFKVGGAHLIGGTLDYDFSVAVIAGNSVHVATGSYTVSETLSSSAAGTATAPIRWTGYTSSRDDLTVGTDRPLFTATNYFRIGNYSIIRNFRTTSTYSEGFYPGAYSNVFNCKFQNTGVATKNAISLSNYASIANCEAISTNGTAIECGSNSFVISCYAHDSVTGYVFPNGYPAFITNSIADTCTTGISSGSTAASSVVGNTVYNCTTGISGTTGIASFVNNIITVCTTGASWTTAEPVNFWDYNCWNNTTDVSNVTKGPHDITADPLLTAPANGDFTLQAGSPCLDTGLQIGANEGVTGDYKVNIGVDQDDNAAAPAGGGATVYMGNF